MTLRTSPLMPILLLSLFFAGCEPGDGTPARGSADGGPERTGPEFRLAGKLESNRLDEASGLQSTADGVLILHNDEGTRLYFTDATGSNRTDARDRRYRRQ
jgi:hypothetical protein